VRLGCWQIAGRLGSNDQRHRPEIRLYATKRGERPRRLAVR
jgi:hypothetical protein